MLTANARPEHVRASREAGADLHLEKPITSAMLFAAIGQAFEAAQGAPETVARGLIAENSRRSLPALRTSSGIVRQE
jgi:DNA-binding response OmpR family regulator